MDIPYSPEKIVLSTFQHPDHPTGHNRSCQIFRDHLFRWCDLRMENEVLTDQRTNVTSIVIRMMLCRDPEGVYARYICPGCGFEHRGDPTSPFWLGSTSPGGVSEPVPDASLGADPQIVHVLLSAETGGRHDYKHRKEVAEKGTPVQMAIQMHLTKQAVVVHFSLTNGSDPFGWLR